MPVPKLPLIVPKSALSATSNFVPKIAPRLSPVILPKTPGSSKSIHNGANFPPKKPEDKNSGPKLTEKSTRLVNTNNMGLKGFASSEESGKDVDSTHENTNVSHVRRVPTQPSNHDSDSVDTTNLNFTKTRRRSTNSSFQDELASRLNRSSILTDLSFKNSNKGLTKTFSNSQTQNNLDKFSKLSSKDPEYFKEDKNSTANKNFNKVEESNSDDRDDVGYTPWLKIERRINQIRSMASDNLGTKAARKDLKSEPNLYGNYNTHYEDGGWKKELTHPLSYGIVQKLDDNRQFELVKDNWKFINGFIKPRKKPFTDMSEMSKYFKNVGTGDQFELIKLLLACRDLEKVIEEQHTVLDMLDHDLREARDLLPDSLNDLTNKKLEGSNPEENPFYPQSELPLFMKGQIFLLPKNGKDRKGNKRIHIYDRKKAYLYDSAKYKGEHQIKKNTGSYPYRRTLLMCGETNAKMSMFRDYSSAMATLRHVQYSVLAVTQF